MRTLSQLDTDTPSSTADGMLSRIRQVIRLESIHLRRSVSTGVVLIAAGLLIASTAASAISWQVSIGVGVVSTVFFVTLLLDHVLALQSEGTIEIFADENAVLEAQQKYIRSRSPKSVKMLEYSGFTVTAIFNELSNHTGVKSVKLLICDPSKANEWQRDYRILPVIASLPITLGKRSDLRLQVRCYSQPASLRGRNYNDDLIVAGWYTRDRRDGQPEEEQLWGGQNALVMTPCDNPSGSALRKTFNQVFDSMWESAVPLKKALEPYPQISSCFEQKWLERVSEEATRRSKPSIRQP